VQDVLIISFQHISFSISHPGLHRTEEKGPLFAFLFIQLLSSSLNQDIPPFLLSTFPTLFLINQSTRSG
jgi:hypothetical protein